VRDTTFTEVEDLRAEDLIGIGAPLLTAVSSSTSRYRVTDVFYPFFPMEESLRGTQFTFTEDSMRNFMAQSICSIALRQSSTAITTPTLDAAALRFCKGKVELFKRFNSVCNQVLNNRKMSSRNTFFKSLGYAHLFPTSGAQYS